MSIIIRDLSHIYNSGTPLAVSALQDINLEIGGGESLGIIGRTGSGKSTLVQHLNGLLLPTRGKVIVDGIDLSDKKSDRKRVRQKVGLVFQYPEYQLFEETVAADVAFGPRNLGLGEAEIAHRVQEALAVVDLDSAGIKDRSPFELSGGQMRRVAIAGVVAMHPQVLVLDEPTAGLDPKGRADLLLQISRMRQSLGITVVLVSHSMEEVAQIVDRVVVMDGGRIALQGKVRDVFAQVENLHAIGLGIPQVTELMYRLKQQGVDVPTEVLTVAEAKAAILAWRRDRENA